MITEKIKNTFDEIAQIYDTQRKALIPCYDDFYEIVTDLILPENPNARILDIGAGTGLLTNFLINKLPECNFTLIDVSHEMLSFARQRFTHYKNVQYIADDYFTFSFNEKFDYIVSALSIHHFNDQKKELLYKKIYSILNNGGVFINADQVLAPFDNIEKKYQENWKSKIEGTNLPIVEKEGAYQRMKLDIPGTLNNNLLWLENAGFSEFDVIYKYYNFAILYARK